MKKIILKIFTGIICLILTLTHVLPMGYAQPSTHLGGLPAGQAGVFKDNLPEVGAMVTTSPDYMPPALKGIIINPENPFAFDFVLDEGDAHLTEEAMKAESEKLIKYFLTSLTLPEDDLWVNLSPYEKDRIIPSEFGKTQMGKVLLEQDYLLKQLTSTLMFPDEELGAKFWNKVYAQAYAKYGTTDIPVETFNKVWIVPNKAAIYEQGDRAFVVESHLKVMLEEDYVAASDNVGAGLAPARNDGGGKPLPYNISTHMIREILIPEIEREVNEGTIFAPLRQIYHSFILASWYKKNLKESILNQAYADQKKIGGLETDEPNVKQKIYQRYLDAFKTGVYDIIKEEYDASSQTIVPRKYFAGGLGFNGTELSLSDKAMFIQKTQNQKGFIVSSTIIAPDAEEPLKDSSQITIPKEIEEAIELLKNLPKNPSSINNPNYIINHKSIPNSIVQNKIRILSKFLIDLRNKNDTQNIALILDKIQNQNPKNLMMRMLIGKEYFHIKEFKKTESIFKEIMEEYPKNAEAYQFLANNYLRQNKFQKAEEIILIALEKKMKSGSLYKTAGDIYLKWHLSSASTKLADAEKSFLNALIYSPEDEKLQVQLKLIDIYKDQFRFIKVEELIKQMIKKSPDNKIFYHILAHAQFMQTKNDTTKYIEAKKNAQISIMLHLGNKQLNIFNYTKCDSGCIPGLNLLASIYLGIKDYLPAKEISQKVLELNPNDKTSRHNLAKAVSREGDFESVWKILDIKRFPMLTYDFRTYLILLNNDISALDSVFNDKSVKKFEKLLREAHKKFPNKDYQWSQLEIEFYEKFSRLKNSIPITLNGQSENLKERKFNIKNNIFSPSKKENLNDLFNALTFHYDAPTKNIPDSDIITGNPQKKGRKARKTKKDTERKTKRNQYAKFSLYDNDDSDEALLTQIPEPIGGIAFDPEYLDIQTSGEEVDMSLLTNPMHTIHIENGLVPRIDSIVPVSNIPWLFTQATNEDKISFLEAHK